LASILSGWLVSLVAVGILAGPLGWHCLEEVVSPDDLEPQASVTAADPAGPQPATIKENRSRSTFLFHRAGSGYGPLKWAGINGQVAADPSSSQQRAMVTRSQCAETACAHVAALLQSTRLQV